MLLTITILFILVGVNFLLLVFSCNKTTKKETPKEKVKVIKSGSTIQQASNHLAPTGS